MAFNLHLHQFKDKGASWITPAFYFMGGLAVVILAAYGIFAFKAQVQRNAIKQVESSIAMYGTQEQKDSEKEIMAFKEKLEDFAAVMESHKLSSGVFAFIEKNTLEKVWFSNFDMSGTTGDIRLAGIAENMQTLSQQVLVFEQSDDYVAGITILDSQLDASGKIGFTLSLSLKPKIFSYPSNGNQ